MEVETMKKWDIDMAKEMSNKMRNQVISSKINSPMFIGIDPDTEKSGVATWDKTKKVLKLERNMDLFSLLKYIDTMSHLYSIRVYVSAGWRIKKTNFHRKNVNVNYNNPISVSKYIGTIEKIMEKVGANHEIGKQIMKYCDSNNIEAYEVTPRGKVDSKTFRKYTGWTHQSNQEQRDAAMTIFGR